MASLSLPLVIMLESDAETTMLAMQAAPVLEGNTVLVVGPKRAVLVVEVVSYEKYL